jgi:hypothetical protein
VVFSASPTLTGTVTGANSNWSGNVDIGTATQQGLLTVYGASTVASAASAKLDYVSLPAATTTITGTTNITTAKGFNAASFYQPTFTDSSAVTITNAATLYVDNAPAAAGSATITNPWAISVGAGNVSFPGTGNALGTITSGTWNGSAINLSSYASGTLQAAQFPALTGDVTTSSGSLATTVAKIQGTTVSGTTGSGNVVFSASPTLTGTATGAASNWSGKVGIGTSTPQSLVHAYGGEVQVGSSGASCATANNGAIRYSASTLYYCTGTTWTAINATSGTKSTLQFNDNNTPYFANTTYYTGVCCAGTGSGNCPANIPYAGTLKNMITTVSAAPGSGNSITVTLQINGSSVNETCTISNTATSCQDTTHTDSVSVGGLVQVQAVYSTSAASSTLGAAVEYDSP